MISIEVSIEEAVRLWRTDMRTIIERMYRAVAAESRGRLRRVRNNIGNLWPVRTGESRRLWQAFAHDGYIEMRNSADHASLINNAPVIRGHRNRNLRSAQRTIESQWDQITEKALNKVLRRR